MDDKIGPKLAPFNPTSDEVINTALQLLDIKNGDKLYDLGCGDARLLVQACKTFENITTVGVEYDAGLVQRANALVESNQLSEKIQIIHDNVLNIDFSDATALFIYLVPEGMKQLKDQLCECLARGVRIVTYVFSIPGVEPKQVEVYKSSTKIYLYN